jgi:hypothetical protein
MDSGCEATSEHLHNERHNDEHEQHGNDDRGDGSHGESAYSRQLTAISQRSASEAVQERACERVFFGVFPSC